MWQHYTLLKLNRLIALTVLSMTDTAMKKTVTRAAATVRATYRPKHSLDIQNQYCLSCLACSFTNPTEWPFPLLTSITSIFSNICTLLVRTMVTASWVQCYRNKAATQGTCSGDLLTARAEEKATFMSRSGGQITTQALQGELTEN